MRSTRTAGLAGVTLDILVRKHIENAKHLLRGARMRAVLVSDGAAAPGGSTVKH